jgi:predicted membrane chloride channel (bestrophin family)
MKSVEFRAVLRTIGMLLAVVAGVAFFYLLTILGALPGFLILCVVVAVFILYDVNKSYIRYEDKLAEITEKFKK